MFKAKLWLAKKLFAVAAIAVLCLTLAAWTYIAVLYIGPEPTPTAARSLLTLDEYVERYECSYQGDCP